MTGRRGRFVSFEGGEGAGKSTQIRLLAERLRTSGQTVVMTREPGGSVGAEEIRNLIVTGDPQRWDATTEALLISAARRAHVTATIAPALAQGHWVLTDRFTDSTLAYQGYGHGLPLDMLRGLAAIATGGLAPDLTLILDLPVEIGLGRALARRGSETRFEQLDQSFHQRLRGGFRQIAEQEPTRCRLIDADQPIEAVAALVAQIVAQTVPQTLPGLDG